MSITVVEKLEALANGVDPITGEILPESSIFHHPEAIRMLFQLVSEEKKQMAKKQLKGLQLDHQEQEVFERLRVWRKQEADEQGLAAFHIFDNATLERIAVSTPSTLEELGEVRGMGPVKLDKYGNRILEILTEG